MPLLVRCPNPACGKVGRVPGSALGRTIRCPLCRRAFVAAPATLGTGPTDSTKGGAGRPGLGERAARWARRRPHLAGALAVAAVGLVVLTAVEAVVGYGSASLARSENEARERAERLRQEEDEAHRRADDARAEAEQARQEIEQKRRQKVEARDRAGRLGQDARAEQEQAQADRLERVKGQAQLEQERKVTKGVQDQAEKDRQAGEAVSRQVEDRRLKEKLAGLKQRRHDIADHWHRANYAAGAVAYSRDGTRLAGVGTDRAVHVWDTTNGKQLLVLPPDREVPPDHNGVVAVALSPDGSRLATAGWHDGLKLWDAANGKELRTLEGHVEKVWSVAFSPDGKTLASAGQDGVVFLWDAATGRQTQALAGHAGAVTHVAFSSDGQRLASGSFDRTVKLWDVSNGQEIQTLTEHTDTVADVAFSPDGKRLASAGADRTVRVWDLAAGKQVYFRGHATPFCGVAYSPDGKRLAAAATDRAVLVLDADRGQTLLTFEAAGEAGAGLAGLAFRPDGRQLALVEGVFDRRGWPSPGGVEVWDGGAGRQTCTVRLATGKATLVAFGGPELVGATDQEVRVWDPATGQAVRSLANVGNVLAVAPDGGNAAGVSRDGIWLVDLKGGAKSTLSKWKASDNLGSSWVLAFSADGRRLAFGIGGPAGGVVKLWDVPRARELPELTWRALMTVGLRKSVQALPVSAVAMSPDGAYLAESTPSGVRLWYAERQQDRGTFASPGGTHSVLHLAFSPDGKQLALGTDNGLWLKDLGADPLTRLTRKGVMYNARPGTDGVQKRGGSGLAFSPDSLLLAAVSHDGEVTAWRTGTHKVFLSVAAGKAVGTAFGPDGRLLAVLQQDGTIIVWDLPGTRPLLSMK
jgi:WD40 repeat protein